MTEPLSPGRRGRLGHDEVSGAPSQKKPQTSREGGAAQPAPGRALARTETPGSLSRRHT